jgi:GT2 family glycosyltransferase
MAYNLAMPFAFADGCEWVIWANNDIRIEPGCLAEMVHAAQNDPGMGVIGPGFLAWEKDEPNYYMIGNHPYAIPAMMSKSREPIEVEWVEGSFVMVNRRCIEAVGPLDPYLHFYWEEADFCRRARFQGWRVALVPSAVARHFGGGSSIGDPKKIAPTNQLSMRNHYIYKLTNPFQGFSRNLLNAFYLFLVHMHYHFPKHLSMVQLHTRIFLAVLQDMRAIYYKWVRDLKGEHPPRVAAPFRDLSAEVIQSRPRR